MAYPSKKGDKYKVGRSTFTVKTFSVEIGKIGDFRDFDSLREARKIVSDRYIMVVPTKTTGDSVRFLTDTKKV